MELFNLQVGCALPRFLRVHVKYCKNVTIRGVS